jgi:hypothetical protein
MRSSAAEARRCKMAEEIHEERRHLADRVRIKRDRGSVRAARESAGDDHVDGFAARPEVR